METAVVALLTATAIVVVLAPVSGRRRPRPPAPTAAEAPLSDAALDAEVARYRAAFRAGTICGRCRYANPGDSRYCADCGRRLSSAG